MDTVSHNNRGPFGTMKPCCNVNHHGLSNTYRCDLKAGHTGSHMDSRYKYTWSAAPEYTSWFQKEWEGVTDARYKARVTGEFPKKTTVQLDAEELKILAYYLTAVHEDYLEDLAVKEKIDKALKELL